MRKTYPAPSGGATPTKAEWRARSLERWGKVRTVGRRVAASQWTPGGPRSDPRFGGMQSRPREGDPRGVARKGEEKRDASNRVWRNSHLAMR